jgi:hypothetical protein
MNECVGAWVCAHLPVAQLFLRKTNFYDFVNVLLANHHRLLLLH